MQEIISAAFVRQLHFYNQKNNQGIKETVERKISQPSFAIVALEIFYNESIMIVLAHLGSLHKLQLRVGCRSLGEVIYEVHSWNSRSGRRRRLSGMKRVAITSPAPCVHYVCSDFCSDIILMFQLFFSPPSSSPSTLTRRLHSIMSIKREFQVNFIDCLVFPCSDRLARWAWSNAKWQLTRQLIADLAYREVLVKIDFALKLSRQ